ncbi:MAG: element excision factor XisH family protein [Blastocatellia bacterium]
MDDLQKASGQFHMYREIVARLYPERTLYMAVSKAVFESIFAEMLGALMIETMNIRMIVFDPHTQRITKWIS